MKKIKKKKIRKKLIQQSGISEYHWEKVDPEDISPRMRLLVGGSYATLAKIDAPLLINKRTGI